MTTRILHVATIARTIDAFLVSHARFLSSLGLEVGAAADGAPNMTGAGAFSSVYDVPFRRDIGSPLAVTRSMRALSVALDDFRPHIVHLHTPQASAVARLVPSIRAKGRKIVYTAHGLPYSRSSSPRGQMAAGLAERLLALRVDAITVMNFEDYEEVSSWRTQVPIFRTSGIGVPRSWFHDIRSPQHRPDITGASGPIHISCVSELTERKRVADAVEAVASADADVHLQVIGDGHLERSLRRLAKRLSVEVRVSFLGQRNDVADLLTSSDGLVLTSAREGLPRSVMEAMALGVPVIGSSARGTVDLLAGGRGYLYPTGDVKALAAIFEKWRCLPHETTSLLAREHIEKFSEDHVIQEFASIYASVLGDLSL